MTRKINGNSLWDPTTPPPPELHYQNNKNNSVLSSWSSNSSVKSFSCRKQTMSSQLVHYPSRGLPLAARPPLPLSSHAGMANSESIFLWQMIYNLRPVEKQAVAWKVCRKAKQQKVFVLGFWQLASSFCWTLQRSYFHFGNWRVCGGVQVSCCVQTALCVSKFTPYKVVFFKNYFLFLVLLVPFLLRRNAAHLSSPAPPPCYPDCTMNGFAANSLFLSSFK